MPSFNVSLLDNVIVQDIPGINLVLQALAKQDVSTFTDIPEDSKRMVVDSNNRITFQSYKSGKWTTFTKILHDVDKVDGYHAAITPNANTIAVRNADKKLEGDITGNAATATTATTISGTLPINKGGTNATTAEKARENLGAPPKSHASSTNVYGIATNDLFGHVRANTETTQILAGEVVAKDIAVKGNVADLASTRGQIGCVPAALDIDDFNDATDAGCYFLGSIVASAAANRPPTIYGGFLIVEEYTGKSYIRQTYFVHNSNLIYTRWKNVSVWGAWNRLITDANTATTSAYGITKLTSAVNSTSEVLAATAKGLKIAYDKAVAAVNAAAAIIPKGTRMLFHQAAAPTGWTKQTTVNDAALRVVSGTTGGGTGGSLAFSTLFATGKTATISGKVSETTLTANQNATHGHATCQGLPYGDDSGYPTGNNQNSVKRGLGGQWNNAKVVIYTLNSGGSQSHTHTLSGKATIALNVKYTDVIICAKA